MSPTRYMRSLIDPGHRGAAVCVAVAVGVVVPSAAPKGSARPECKPRGWWRGDDRPSGRAVEPIALDHKGITVKDGPVRQEDPAAVRMTSHVHEPDDGEQRYDHYDGGHEVPCPNLSAESQPAQGRLAIELQPGVGSVTGGA